MTRAHLPLNGEERNERRGWPLLAVAVSGRAGLSPIELQSVLLLVGQKREEQVGPGFYVFEVNGSNPVSAALFADMDALVAAEHLTKQWMPEATESVLRLSEAGQAWAAEFRRKVKKDVLIWLEDAVAWVKEQSHLNRVHKTSTIRVIA